MKNLSKLTKEQINNVTTLYFVQKSMLSTSVEGVAKMVKAIQLLAPVDFATAAEIIGEMQEQESKLIAKLSKGLDMVNELIAKELVETKKFIVDNEYEIRFIGDSDLRPLLKLVNRTDKSAWITKSGDFTNQRVKIYTDSNGDEYILPYGKYSMSPVVRA